MTLGTRKFPLDITARERLREAQRKEAALLARVAATDAALCRAKAKRDNLLTTAGQGVARAEGAVLEAERALVAVSGLERAATLRGCAVGELRRRIRRTVAGASGSNVEAQE